jgi:C-terminal processing protease CtpA/Prc
MIASSIRGKLFVSDIYDGSPADRAGILTGDEILSADGRAYDQIASFRGKVGRTVVVQLRRHPRGTPLATRVEVERLDPLRTFERAIEESIEVIEHDGRRIGYVRLWTLAVGTHRIIAKALASGQLKDADGLIVDLRGRWGGRYVGAELLVDDVPPLSLCPTARARTRTDTGRSAAVAPSRDRGEEHSWTAPPGHSETRRGARVWSGPIVAIVDSGSRSALEAFAYALKANGIPLVGTRTAGALLPSQAIRLPDDSLLLVPVSDAVIGDGVRLEGRGVPPDVSVPFSLPYAAGEDPQREAAIEEMRRILASQL